jgi:hypothetical protein
MNPNFVLWCNKTESLTPDDFTKAFDRLEEMLEQNARNTESKEIWPPSYAEFVGLAKEAKRANGSYKDFYERDENGVAIRLPEPEYQRQKRKEKGTKALGGILNMFNGGE